MAENRKGGQATARNKVEKALIQALEEDMGEIPEASITVDELKALESADKKKRKKRTARYISVAAIAVIVCAAVVYVAWPETAVPVDADKNTEQRVETGEGEIVINEGDVQDNSGITEYTETDWNKVENLRQVAPQLAIPKYVPDKYLFKKTYIEAYEEDGFSAETTFENKGAVLYISQRQYDGNNSKITKAKGNFEVIESSLGKVYLAQEKGQSILATAYISEGQINISGDISKAELIKILNNIEMP